MNKFLLSLTLCGLTTNAFALSVDDNVLLPGSVLEADFAQHRYIDKIPFPVESKGHLILWEGHGLVWSTSEPFPDTLLMTRNGLYRIEEGRKTLDVKTGGDAMFGIMTALFDGRDKRKIEGFDARPLADNEGKRRISLTPLHPQILNFIRAIIVEGNTYVSRVTLIRPNGDRDEIEITGHSVKNEASRQLQDLFMEGQRENR